MKIKMETAILLLFLSALFALVVSGCSSSNESKDHAQNEADIEASSEEVAYDEDEDTGYDASDNADIIDKGDPCRYHLYSVPPGFSGILSFEVELKNKIDREADFNTLTIRDDTWDQYDITVSVMSAEKETITVPYRVWTLDGSDFYNDSLERSKDPRISREPISVVTKGVTIKWKNDGYGIISRIKGYGDAKNIGKFSEEELAKRLGGNLEVAFRDPESGKEYTWYVEPGTEEREVMILNFDLAVTLPEEGSRINNQVINVWARQTGWTVKVKCFLKSGPFTISGPAISSECFESSEY